MESVPISTEHPPNSGGRTKLGTASPGQRENPLVESGSPGYSMRPRQSPRMQQAAAEIQQVLEHHPVTVEPPRKFARLATDLSHVALPSLTVASQC